VRPFQNVPAVEWIAPTLPGRGEVVRWHTCHVCGLPALVQEEQPRAGPHVGALVRDEDWRIPDQTDATGLAVFTQPEPLPIE
jgi:hypothetical protein